MVDSTVCPRDRLISFGKELHAILVVLAYLLLPGHRSGVSPTSATYGRQHTKHLPATGWRGHSAFQRVRGEGLIGEMVEHDGWVMEERTIILRSIEARTVGVLLHTAYIED